MNKGDGKIFPRNPDLKRRVCCFIGSVVFHAAIIGLVISLFSPVEFQIYEKVADVIIASPGRIKLPPIDRAIARGEDISAPMSLPQAAQSPEGADEAGRMAEDEPGSAAGRSIRRGRLPQDKIATLPPELTSRFRLDSQQSEKSGFSLNINPAETEAPETEREITIDELNLLNYLQSDPARTHPLRGNPSRTIRAGISPRSQSVEGNVVEYDITPWADSAVARIQRNWLIPPSQGKEEKKSVEISVVVAKSGELLSFEIRNSSGIQSLDMAALNAIKMSSPLPALPNDFPLDSLEADLLFQYYE